MPEHAERVRRHYDHDRPEDMQQLPITKASLTTDVKRLLDYLEGEYVGPDVARALRRVRAELGPS